MRNQYASIDDTIVTLTKQVQQEKLLKSQAVNKLAEIMNRKDMTPNKSKGNLTDLRKKEKECRKLQQELTSVSRVLLFVNFIWSIRRYFIFLGEG